MGIFNSINISSSALTMQRLRMDVVSSNMANADTTRGKLVNGVWEPYRRKLVEISSAGDENSFGSYFNHSMNPSTNVGSGVKVTKISEDQSPFKLVYNPSSPDADQNGYVKMPNVDPLKEMVDLMDASRAYEANVTVLNASKGMLLKALEIGK
ncbi:flagellar basal body rod protein FlgC [Bacillus sp. RG28]|uniref:Flagellar basal-body rod protein FlgC n=1 Tax=Gottfriedia endophytica TaxID=2820819 RepID=A0A940SKP7_9BACI|nr:flagellar basal body rod protein FlgC [Gottfriedia endophytica]MBP0726244.1 flagellar basal body rod protein FlgC [Gottfriedia endophytica]